MQKLLCHAFLAVIIFSGIASAQVSITSPATAAKVKSCDDFATLQLNDPWDMNNNADVNRHLPGDLADFASASISSGLLNAVTAGSTATFYLFSPQIEGSYPVGGRWGQNLDLNTAKYNYLSMRLYLDTQDSGGLKFIWPRGLGYTSSRTVTDFVPTRTGWHNYRVNLSTLGISLSESSDTRSWSSGSITGFGIQPQHVGSAAVAIDWIRLEDSTSCGSQAINYNAAALGSDSLYSVYLDSDSDPWNGYEAKLVEAGSAASGSVSLSTLGVAPGSYNLIGLMYDDYASIVRDDPWDMNESSDVLLTSGISSGTFANGEFSGTTSATGSTIYLRVPSGGIDAAVFKRLSLKLTRSTNDTFHVFWNGTSSGVVDLIPAVHDANNDNVYEVNLGAQGAWTGTITEIILRPTDVAGGTFSLDFFSLRATNYVTSLGTTTTLAASSNLVSAAGRILVNNPPLLDIWEPNSKGGEAVRPWNMNSGDVLQYSNLRDDSDPLYPGEAYTSFLPDVRSIDGVRGDFFKGTNKAGNDDPNNFLLYSLASGTFAINAADYPAMCFRLLIDYSFDLCLGSVGRVIWQDTNAVDTVGEDIVLIRDGWSSSKWYEYCLDLTRYTTEYGNGWSGIIQNLRVDPHEFSKDSCASGGPGGNDLSVTYYFDSVKLRKRDGSKSGKYSIVFDLQDSDDAATVDLFYGLTASTSGGTLIASLAEGQSSYVWDTSGVPNGTYYVYGVASDGLNSVSRLASGPVVVANDSSGSGSAPVLSVEAPTQGLAVCDSLQLKGFSLEPDRNEDVSSVEVHVDGTLFATIRPGLYSSNAKTAYPALDSSNSGFNNSYNFSGYANGAHTVLLKAISSDGDITTSETINVIKQSSGCPDPVVDPDPSGSPVNVDVPELPQPTTPGLSRAVLSKTGQLLLKVERATEEDAACSIRVLIGDSSESVTSSAGSARATTKSVTLVGKGVKANKKSLKTFYVKVIKSCSGYENAETRTRKVKVLTSKGATTISELASTIAQKIKVQKSSKKKKNRKRSP